ncbi:hypothetical protein [Sphingobium sp. SCG-1]|uniref:hypothetical protein n=1 Tax=Sphingobium sp. SCG-1 TaxID=2072936 RepID=UPI0011AB7326|nr:hypothetical protein [Sphingobium sp. SCG-1]
MRLLRILGTYIRCLFITDRYARRKARAVATLPDILRMVYGMKYDDQLNDTDIAELLGITERDVMRHRAWVALHVTRSLDRQYRRAAQWRRLWPFRRGGGGKDRE